MPSGRTRAWDGSHRRPSRLACRHRVRNGTERSRSLGASRPAPLRLTSKQDLFNQGLWLPMDESQGARHLDQLADKYVADAILIERSGIGISLIKYLEDQKKHRILGISQRPAKRTA